MATEILPYLTDKIKERFWSRVNKTDGCWEWTASHHPSGYGQIRLAKKESRIVTRVAWAMERGEIPDGLFVLHKCDNPKCVRIDHLFLGTAKDNSQDMAKKGRMNFQRRPQDRPRGDRHHSKRTPHVVPKGEQCHKAKFTETQVREIRNAYAAGDTTFHKLAAVYGVVHSTIAAIVLRRNWKHVT